MVVVVVVGLVFSGIGERGGEGGEHGGKDSS